MNARRVDYSPVDEVAGSRGADPVQHEQITLGGKGRLAFVA